MPTLRPLQDYDPHDVINFFSWSGAVPAYKGTMVKIASPSGFVASDDEPVEMFGADFSTSKYYMVIETKRSQGKVSITAREVG